MENKLYEKKIIWNGDSICAGSKQTGNWATRIADNCGAECINYAVGGGTVAEGLPKMKSGADRHSVSATLDKMYAEHPDADYVIFDGGTNDADLLGNVFDMDKSNRLGSFEPYNYDGNYDVTTFCGALESVFYRATKYWTGKKIGFIVAQKMGMHRREFSNRRFYFDEAVEICKKWGIPYLDLWNGCYLNPQLEWMYASNNTADKNKQENIGYYTDGQHLTSNGYDLTAEIIEAWMKTL